MKTIEANYLINNMSMENNQFKIDMQESAAHKTITTKTKDFAKGKKEGQRPTSVRETSDTAKVFTKVIKYQRIIGIPYSDLCKSTTFP